MVSTGDSLMTTNNKRRRLSTKEDVTRCLRAYEAGLLDINPPRNVVETLRRYCQEMAVLHDLPPKLYTDCVLDQEFTGWYALFEFLNDPTPKVQTQIECTLNPFRANAINNCSLGKSSANSAGCMWHIGLFVGPFLKKEDCEAFCTEWRPSRGKEKRYQKGLSMYRRWIQIPRYSHLKVHQGNQGPPFPILQSK